MKTYLAATILALTIIQPLIAREDMRRTLDKGDQRRNCADCGAYHLDPVRDKAVQKSLFTIIRELLFGK